ncbi:MAG: hypothetical protein OXH52_05990 [Gammaproteobacteria bacterium]|nr:hypothetical protein [Gammaproteobacteria bacterium]
MTSPVPVGATPMVQRWCCCLGPCRHLNSITSSLTARSKRIRLAPSFSAGTLLKVAVTGVTVGFRMLPRAVAVHSSAPKAFRHVTVNVSSLSSRTVS